ncbi:hypothetical protein EDB83DRAFT_1544854 [Lactarius deliciosus]|nr:hypothetical protein EDB83DRAFT_1544854 [Lactarius deliciosus]
MPVHQCLSRAGILARSARVIHGVWVFPPVAFICTPCPFMRCYWSRVMSRVQYCLTARYPVEFLARGQTFPRVSHALPALAGSLVSSCTPCPFTRYYRSTISRLGLSNADVIQIMLNARVIGSALCQLRSASDVRCSTRRRIGAVPLVPNYYTVQFVSSSGLLSFGSSLSWDYQDASVLSQSLRGILLLSLSSSDRGSV